MKYLTLIGLLVLVGCGSDVEYVKYVDRVKTEYVDRVETETEYVPVAQEFEGIYYFDNGGYLEIIMGADSELTLMREGQYLQCVNPHNDTICSHPVIYMTGLEVQDGKLQWSQNINYVTGNAMLDDVRGRSITGSRRVDFMLQMVDDNLQLTVNIYNAAMNQGATTVVAQRILTSN